MSEPNRASWDRPGDDGVLDDDTLASDDMTRDRLDYGIDAPDAYSIGEGWGNTAAEARQGESLEQLLAEEEPDQDMDSPMVGTHRDREAGQLQTDGPTGTSPSTATQFGAVVPEDERSSEQAAMHIHEDTE